MPPVLLRINRRLISWVVIAAISQEMMIVTILIALWRLGLTLRN
jgi:hypothetical protein